MNRNLTRLIFPRGATAQEMADAIEEVRRNNQRKNAVENPHAEKAKELLVHRLSMAANGDAGDPDEAATIIDHIVDAVHFEIEREIKAVLASIQTPGEQPQQES